MTLVSSGHVVVSPTPGVGLIPCDLTDALFADVRNGQCLTPVAFQLRVREIVMLVLQELEDDADTQALEMMTDLPQC